MGMTNRMSRRELLAASGVAPALAPAEAPKRPNFVLFMPETLRAESIACYGHPLVRTPNLDRLAGQGVRFTQCHVQNTVCGPSRCSLMTGWPVHVRGHRSLYYFLHPDEPNLFRYLREKGYDVYWYGKNDLLPPPCEFRRTRSAPAPTPSPVPASPPPSQSNPRPSAASSIPHGTSFIYWPIHACFSSAGPWASFSKRRRMRARRRDSRRNCLFAPDGAMSWR